MKVFIVTLTDEQKEDILLENYNYNGTEITSFCSFVIADEQNDMYDDIREDNEFVKNLYKLAKETNENIILDNDSESTFSLWIPVTLYEDNLVDKLYNKWVSNNISTEKNTLFLENFE